MNAAPTIDLARRLFAPVAIATGLAAASVAVGLQMGSQGAAGEDAAQRQTSESQSQRSNGKTDGEHKHTNRLINETSPYLLQHAHNPVDWHPWGAEAFEAARQRDKPIFLSIGYSTCYWCHVMERKVFEDPEIAETLNERFVSIKVDREQRPDIDEVYMTATQLLTGGGGWPMSVFLTPDLKPFYAATYIPPKDRGRRPGFPTVVTSLHDAWENRRQEVLSAADRIANAIERTLGERVNNAPDAELSLSIPDQAVSQLTDAYDGEYGGFGVRPKFPSAYQYRFLLDAHDRTGDDKTRRMAVDSLRKIAAGGVHDHIGGGFHRYSTDQKWLVPHFEKMLYNQAQLARAYTEALRRTDGFVFERTIHRIFKYVDERMTGPDGQFYSALDAETDAVEGAYYVWPREKIEQLLNDEQMALFDEVFSLAPIPSRPGHKEPHGQTLHMSAPMSELADRLDLTQRELSERLEPILDALQRERKRRKLPRLDDKTVLGWNGLMIAAYADAARALDHDGFLDRAIKAAEFSLENMRTSDGRMMRIWRQGEATIPAFQQDYAFFIQGLIALHRAGGERRWLDTAVELTRDADELFWDEDNGGYFFTERVGRLIARSKSPRDKAVPSGNAAMAHNLIDLHQLTGNRRYRDRAERILTIFSGLISQSPRGHLNMVHAAERFLTLDEEQAKAEGGNDASEQTGVALPSGNDLNTDAASGSPSSAERVKLAAEVGPEAVAPGETFTVRVTLKVDEGWHINADRTTLKQLVPTAVDVRSDAPIETVRIEYPEPTRLEPAFADQPIAVFAGTVEIAASVRLGEDAPIGSSASLRVLASYQACDDSTCLKPSDSVIKVPLRVRDAETTDARG